MHEDERWQVFSQNGNPITGRGEVDEVFALDDQLVMGNAHVWIWRINQKQRQILLQKRSMTRTRSPGLYHVSAAGHINIGETPVDAAVRETQEEMGVVLDISKLYFVQTIRGGRSGQSLNSVFVYEVNDDSFRFDDGEVESVKWVDLVDFDAMARNASKHNLIDQGIAYFDRVIEAIKSQ